MKRRTTLGIAVSLLLSSAFMFVLFLYSFDFKRQKNDFLRTFPPHAAILIDTFDIKFNSYYFAGAGGTDVYFGNTTNPLHVLELNIMDGRAEGAKIKLVGIDTLIYWSLRLKVIPPNFFLGDGTLPSIFHGRLNEWKGYRNVYDSAYFVEYEPISPSSFALRSLSSITGEHELGKEQQHLIPHTRVDPSLLERQIDGIFCVDGRLSYDRSLNRVVYTYYYRNQFIVMDSSLNLLFRGKTLDTTNRVKIQVATISSSGTRTLSAPPMIVNGQSFSANGFLFVNSRLLARNERDDAHNEASVIDVYSLKDGAYILSFYLYAFQNKKPREFAIVGDKLIALADHYVLIYKLKQRYFRK